MSIECGVYLPGCTINDVQVQQTKLIIEAETKTMSSVCPSCNQKSRRVHSYRMRSIRDLPVSDRSVELRIRIKRFRCVDGLCPRQTWTETIPEIVARYIRRTKRLTTALWHTAQALGGNPGSRLVYHLKMPVSRDTLIRILRATKVTTPKTPRVIGIDDWAIRKGQSYGTILVDLERRCVLDLLPDREPETVAAWFKSHPNTRIVARDRAAQYAQGVSLGAPQAIQVADRWHLLKNLWDVVERCLQGYQPSQETSEIRGDRERLPRSGPEEKVSQLRYERRVEHHRQIHTLHQQGYSTRRIAKLVGVSRGKVLRYLAVRQLPPAKARSRRSKLDPYLPYLKERVAQGCTHTPTLWPEICEQGYPGSKGQLDKWLRSQRRKLAQPSSSSDNSSNRVALPAPREGTRLLLSASDNLNETDQHHLSLMIQDQPLKALYQHTQQFITMVNTRQSQQLDDWLQAGLDSSFSSYQNFITSLLKDYDAVKAALDLPWSNGPTEGHINKLKCLKRQMYGRAKLDLLRIRLLYSS